MDRIPNKKMEKKKSDLFLLEDLQDVVDVIRQVIAFIRYEF